MKTFEKKAWLISQKDYDQLLQQHWMTIRDIHFDESLGTPYWINAAKEARIDPKNDLDTLQDFLDSPLSLCDEDVLKIKPISHFIPKSSQLSDVSILTSSGSVGKKKEVAWSEIGLEYAAEYADYSFDKKGIRRNIDWVVQGPYGIFQTVVRRALAKRGGLIHSVGVETRNLKIELAKIKSEEDFRNNQFLQTTLGPGIEFTYDMLAKEKIGGLVTAIHFLSMLVSAKGFENVEAIYLSGMEMPKEMYEFWKQKLPHIKFITSFGHHNLGFAYNTPLPGEPYYTPSPLSLVYIVKEDDSRSLVGYGERGRHKILRMDENFLWGQLDRDYSTRVPSQKEYKWDGFSDSIPTFDVKK